MQLLPSKLYTVDTENTKLWSTDSLQLAHSFTPIFSDFPLQPFQTCRHTCFAADNSRIIYGTFTGVIIKDFRRNTNTMSFMADFGKKGRIREPFIWPEQQKSSWENDISTWLDQSNRWRLATGISSGTSGYKYAEEKSKGEGTINAISVHFPWNLKSFEELRFEDYLVNRYFKHNINLENQAFETIKFPSKFNYPYISNTIEFNNPPPVKESTPVIQPVRRKVTTKKRNKNIQQKQLKLLPEQEEENGVFVFENFPNMNSVKESVNFDINFNEKNLPLFTDNLNPDQVFNFQVN